MPTLAATLQTTTPVSPLLRKARRLGINTVADMIDLAAARGCSHYSTHGGTSTTGIPRNELGDDELTILLLVGENPYDPTAIRCAAQLARSPGIEPAGLARLAVMERCERVLSYIARAGLDHDPDGVPFWRELLVHLPPSLHRKEPHLPHWSRFVSMPGIQRSGPSLTRWLTPDR